MNIPSAMLPARNPVKKREKWPFGVGGLVVLLIVSGNGTSTPQPTGELGG